MAVVNSSIFKHMHFATPDLAWRLKLLVQLAIH